MCEFETVWTFETPRYTVALEVAPEWMDPADHFEFQEDIDVVRSGDLEWFTARVSVYRNGYRIGQDILGGCAYHTIAEFLTGHRDPNPMNRNCSIMRAARGEDVVICHYFPSMVREAITDARQTIS